jgi:hypothetical protein
MRLIYMVFGRSVDQVNACCLVVWAVVAPSLPPKALAARQLGGSANFSIDLHLACLPRSTHFHRDEHLESTSEAYNTSETYYTSETYNASETYSTSEITTPAETAHTVRHDWKWSAPSSYRRSFYSTLPNISTAARWPRSVLFIPASKISSSPFFIR